MGFPSFHLWGCEGSINLSVVLNFWSQVNRGRGGGIFSLCPLLSESKLFLAGPSSAADILQA